MFIVGVVVVAVEADMVCKSARSEPELAVFVSVCVFWLFHSYLFVLCDCFIPDRTPAEELQSLV